jgi:hypothetical protein
VLVEGANAHFLALLNLHFDVASTGRVVTDEQGAQAGCPTLGGKASRAVREFHLDSLSQFLTVK